MNRSWKLTGASGEAYVLFLLKPPKLFPGRSSPKHGSHYCSLETQKSSLVGTKPLIVQWFKGICYDFRCALLLVYKIYSDLGLGHKSTHLPMVWQLALFFKLIHQSQFILILGALSVKCHLWSQPMIITSLNKLSFFGGFRSIAPYENINKNVKLLQNVYNLFVYHVSVPSCCRKIVSPGILPWTPHIRYPEFKWTYWKHLLCKQT